MSKVSAYLGLSHFLSFFFFFVFVFFIIVDLILSFFFLSTFVVNGSQARDKLDDRDSGHRDDLVRMGGRRRTRGVFNNYMYTPDVCATHLPTQPRA